VAGFGGFLEAAGGSEREARVRVALLGGLEHGMVAFPCTAAAIVLLVSGRRKPPLDSTLPCAIAPAIGFATAFWAAATASACAASTRAGAPASRSSSTRSTSCRPFRQPRRYGPELGGMLLFRLSDMFALWAAIAAFGLRMNGAAEVVAFGTGMIVTRRTSPLGGAGILMTALPPTLWYSGAPWATAVLGAFAWRSFTLRVPMPFSFPALPRLRALGEKAEETPGEGTETEEDEPALQH
jgi:hypothetical protein